MTPITDNDILIGMALLTGIGWGVWMLTKHVQATGGMINPDDKPVLHPDDRTWIERTKLMNEIRKYPMTSKECFHRPNTVKPLTEEERMKMQQESGYFIPAAQDLPGVDHQPFGYTFSHEKLDERIRQLNKMPIEGKVYSDNDINHTDQVHQGPPRNPQGISASYHLALRTAVRVNTLYGNNHHIEIERTIHGHRWRLLPREGEVELPHRQGSPFPSLGWLVDNQKRLWSVAPIYPGIHRENIDGVCVATRVPFQYNGNSYQRLCVETFISRQNEQPMSTFQRADEFLIHNAEQVIRCAIPTDYDRKMELPRYQIGFDPYRVGEDTNLSTTTVKSIHDEEEEDIYDAVARYRDEHPEPEFVHSEYINKLITSWKASGAMKNAKDISDGYHTFQDLYDMRLALTVGLFRNVLWHSNGAPAKHAEVYRSHRHSDGTMFDGMFIVGLIMWGKQITFHYHNEHWDKFYFAETLDKAPEWDGHTDKDVIERLLAL